ncbi:MAG: hypothetical protein ABI431_02090 [Candidatus Tumulicola sp.]
MSAAAMTIREFDERLYRQLGLCLDGDYIGAGSDALTPAMLDGLRRSIEAACVGRLCDCGEPWCRSFQIAGGLASRESRRVRFRVHGELAVVCDAFGALQHVEWLPEGPNATLRRYEQHEQGCVEAPVCPFPD